MNRLLACLIILSTSSAFADEPLPPPEKMTVCSPTKNLCAMSDPTSSKTFVSSQPPKGKSWVIPGWHRWLFVSDDGESVVVGYDGMNLAPLDVSLDEPVLYFYHHGKLVRTMTLKDFYGSKSQLRRTVSHLAWVNTIGINKANQLVVELIDGRKIAFAASTGQVQPLIPAGT